MGQYENESQMHLDQCPECAQKVLMQRNAQKMLKNLRGRFAGPNSTKCPENVDWPAVAANLLPAEEAQPLIAHAAQCAKCGPLLKMATEDICAEASPEEEDLLRRLAIHTPQWQMRVAEQLGGSTRPVATQSTRNGLWMFKPQFLATAALLLVLAGTWTTIRWTRSPSPVELVSEAYTERRTFEPRILGARYAPPSSERGDRISDFDKPRSLLRANVLISEGLLKKPNDVVLLDAKARAAMLDGYPADAITILKPALETEPGSNIVMLDLGTAYFLQGEKTGDAQDYARAIEYQSKVLAASPNDSTALFNRALAREKWFLYNDALQDWTKFLEIERDPAWLAEGKIHYEDVQRRIKEQGQGQLRISPAHDPLIADSFLRLHTARDGDPDWPKSMDEAYLNVALTDWTATLASVDQNNQRSTLLAGNVLRDLSEIFRRKHRDEWLTDILAGPRSGPWVEGVVELSTAVRANAKGEWEEGTLHARMALDVFRQAGNAAGEAAAGFEYVHALTQSQRGDLCLPIGLQSFRKSQGRRYPWLESSVSYDVSTCYFQRGNPREAMKFARHGAMIAENAGYAVLILDGRYYLDGLSTSSVATSDSWDRIREGLREYWNSTYPQTSAAGFYTDLGFIAEMEQMWHFAETVGEESVATSLNAHNPMDQASTHAWLADVAEGAGDVKVADQEYQKAEEVLEKWGKGTEAARLTFEIARASLNVRQNRLEEGQARLRHIEKNLSSITDQSSLIAYRESLGELYLRLGKQSLAEKELLEAIRLIEMDKQSLSSEADLLTWQHDTSRAYRALLELYSVQQHDDAHSLTFLEWYRGEPLRIDPHFVSDADAYSPRAQAFRANLESEYTRKLIAVSSGVPRLAWVSFAAELVIWELDGSGVHTARVMVPHGRLDETLLRFSRMCADPKSDAAVLHRDAQQLYEWLIEPIAHYLPGSGPLTLEPDDSMYFLPFLALQDEAGRYLGDRYSITESPGLMYSKMMRQEKRISSAAIALSVGDPLPNAQLRTVYDRLPDARREAEDIASRFTEHDLLTEKEATLSNVTRLLRRAEIFHFAGHAVLRNRAHGLLLAPETMDPFEVALLDENHLRPSDIGKLQLAVLSGCETAIAEQGITDPSSLVRAFLHSGVPHVVASKWRINSAVSADTMARFYDRILEGDSIANALSYSQKLVRSNPNTAHPYYWAAFSAFGR
jgi:CHAT domain-containing protein